MPELPYYLRVSALHYSRSLTRPVSLPKPKPKAHRLAFFGKTLSLRKKGPSERKVDEGDISRFCFLKLPEDSIKADLLFRVCVVVIGEGC